MVDVGTHTIFIADVVDGDTLSDQPPMTYAYYHTVKNGKAPKAASTYHPEKDGPAASAPASANTSKKTQWRCTVCGYIYEGDPLPEDFICPVCGKPASVFEKIEVEVPAQEEAKKTQWRCKICGYVYEGDPLPDDYICPICHQPVSAFEKIEVDG